MNKIKTAVIPAGGYGTRFLPATKSIPKEMFPMGGKPIILHVVEELVQAGIEHIIFVVAQHKQSIESFFSSNEALESFFAERGKTQQVLELQNISSLAQYTFVYTKPHYGNGGAIAAAKHIIQNEPFVLVWSDELILTHKKSRIQQCLEAFEKYNKPVISAVQIKDPKKRSRYGMAELRDLQNPDQEVKEIVRIVEKPELGTEPSEYATHGAYVLTPEFFEALEKTHMGPDNEIWLTDVLNNMMPQTGLLARLIEDGTYLDCGNPVDYLMSQIDYALDFSDYSKEVDKLICDRIYCKNPQLKDSTN